MTAKSEVRRLMARHEFRTKRQLGQNFLIDDHVLNRIADAALRDKAARLFEIGPGLGTLTSRLADRGTSIVGIERDRSLLPILQERFADSEDVEFIEANVLKIALSDHCEPNKPFSVVGNIPYNISSPILLSLLAQRERMISATVMLQREVALRLMGRPSTKAYGSLSVLFQLYAEIEQVCTVPPESFIPPPRVHSTVLRLEWLEEPRTEVQDVELFERVVRASFARWA